ncbi:hypothetical protein KY345_02860 [Candidatus Woesearchaeota archaeon]|nr:hypothetical protein [Candidatus Woesearchaeota archaeon]
MAEPIILDLDEIVRPTEPRVRRRRKPNITIGLAKVAGHYSQLRRKSNPYLMIYSPPRTYIPTLSEVAANIMDYSRRIREGCRKKLKYKK